MWQQTYTSNDIAIKGGSVDVYSAIPDNHKEAFARLRIYLHTDGASGDMGVNFSDSDQMRALADNLLKQADRFDELRRLSHQLSLAA